MHGKKELTERQKERIEKLWVRAVWEKPGGLSDSKWIEQKTKIPYSRVARQIQELIMKKYGPKAPLTDDLKKRIEEEYWKPLPEEFIELGLGRVDYVGSKTRIHLQKIRGWISNLYKTKYAVLIIDTTSHSREKMSEIDFVSEMLRIYYVGNYGSSTAPKPIRERKKEEVLKLLRNAKENYIHISAHGIAHDENKSRISTKIFTPFDDLTAEDIYSEENGEVKKLWTKSESKPSLIVCTACESGRIDIARAFWKCGCEYYIAPFQSVPWINSAIFCSLFYYYLIAAGWSVQASFKKTLQTLPNQIGKWRLYRKGKLAASKNLLQKAPGCS